MSIEEERKVDAENAASTADTTVVDADKTEVAAGDDNKADSKDEAINLLGGDDDTESTETEEGKYVHENAPEAYTLDEGVELADTAMFDALSPAFKEANVSNKQLNSIVKAHAEQSALMFNTRKNEMGAQTLKDPLFSGDSGKANIAIANNAVMEYGGKDFAKLLHDSGLGNNINVVKTFYEIGRAMEEDSPVGDKSMGSEAKMSDVDKYYGRTSY